MSERFHLLAQQLLGKSSIEECSLREVEDLAMKYPYFAPAQFMLLQKYKQEDPKKYEAQLQKAVLYYHSPVEFEYFISSDRFYTDEPLPETVPVSETPIIFEEHRQYETDLPAQTESVPEAEADMSPDQIEVLPTEETTPKAETLVEADTDLQVKPEPDVIDADKPSASPDLSDKEKTLSALQTESEKAATANDLVFEPYHTVDYFASQGIKPSQEEVPKDKFGKQLKSFTQWLKTMKRLPAAEIGKGVDAFAEKKVADLASDSVHETEVATEAMAEVWLKQGNREKAIEIYNKLSLLDPSKKAFFAAKIENLKRS